MFLIYSYICHCAIHWRHVLTWEWRCSWSSADRWCSNYIWVINNSIAYYYIMWWLAPRWSLIYPIPNWLNDVELKLQPRIIKMWYNVKIVLSNCTVVKSSKSWCFIRPCQLSSSVAHIVEGRVYEDHRQMTVQSRFVIWDLLREELSAG